MLTHSTPPYPVSHADDVTEPSLTTAPGGPRWSREVSISGVEATALPTDGAGGVSDAGGGGESADLVSALRDGTGDEALTAEQVGRYQLRGALGEGGIGLVDRVYDRHLRREVALKFLRPGLRDRSDRAVIESRFLDEARVTGLLEHPGIVPVHEVGRRADGALYYTMKQIRGRTLRAATRGAGFAERLQLLPRFIALCQAVAYAHSRGVVHRDLKPDNVMLGDFGETLVVDWGLAKVRGMEGAPESLGSALGRVMDGRTLDGQVLGTPAYMPPEQLAGRVAEVDERADVYALGVMLYELVTGQTPFGGGTGAVAFASLAHRVATEPVPPPGSIEARCPPELAAIMLRALEKDPARRYADAGAMVDDVLRFEMGGFVSAHHYSRRERLWRRVRRHRGALLLGLAVLSVAALSWVWRGAREAERAEVAERARKAAVVERVVGLVDEARATRTAGWLDLYPSRLVSLKEPVVEDRIIALLSDDDPALRQLAARTLGLMSSRRAVEPLAARLAPGVEGDETVESDETVVIEIIRALGVIGDPRAEPAVYAARARYGNTSYVGYDTALAYRLLPPMPPPPGADANAWVDHGRALVEKVRLEEGVAAYDRAIAMAPDLVRAYNNRGIAYRQLGRYALALADYDRALSLDPDFMFTLVNRPILYRSRHQLREALVDLDRAVGLEGPVRRAALHNRSLYRAQSGDHAGARADLDLAGGLGTLDRQQMMMEGHIRRFAGDLDDALDHYNRAVDLDPSAALTYQQRARVREERGDRRAARADLDQAWRLDPELPQLAWERAQVLGRLGEWGAARQLADAVVAARPREGGSYALRAIEVHARLGDWGAAAVDLGRATERARPADRVLYGLLQRAAERKAGRVVSWEGWVPLGEVPYHDAMVGVASGGEGPAPATYEARCVLAVARFIAGRGEGGLEPLPAGAATTLRSIEYDPACAFVESLGRPQPQ